jgi:formylglycine-generating enzyme required for sulfatase activity
MKTKIILLVAICQGQLFAANSPALSATNPNPSLLVWIAPGTFVMGSPADEVGRHVDEVQHTVTLTKGFYMGKYCVTQGQYLAVAGKNPSYFTTGNSNGKPTRPDLKRPVEMVNWDAATNFCGLLTRLELEAARIPFGWAYRLPTEAEWEYACRAGTTTAFNFGDAIHGGMANFEDHYEYSAAVGTVHIASPSVPWLARTTTVGSYEPNAFGLYDMHGNVWEWCEDWYGRYPTGSVTDPRGPASGVNRVIRGGSWEYTGVDCRSAVRFTPDPAYGTDGVGFRVVLVSCSP